MKTKTVRFNQVTRVTDDMLRVRLDSGKEITVPKPYDKYIHWDQSAKGEGTITVPESVLCS